MNSLSNLIAMKWKPFLISDLFCSSDSDKRVGMKHASLNFLKKTIVLAPSVHYVQGVSPKLLQKRIVLVSCLYVEGVQPFAPQRSGTLWNALFNWNLFLLVSTQQTSSLHLYWQLIFAPKHKKNSSLLTSSKAQLKYCCNQKHI